MNARLGYRVNSVSRQSLAVMASTVSYDAEHLDASGDRSCAAENGGEDHCNVALARRDQHRDKAQTN